MIYKVLCIQKDPNDGLFGISEPSTTEIRFLPGVSGTNGVNGSGVGQPKSKSSVGAERETDGFWENPVKHGKCMYVIWKNTNI